MIQPHSYTQYMHDQRITIIGPIPPPYGGVSVHIQRTIAYLRTHGNGVQVIRNEFCARRWLLSLYLILLSIRVIVFRPYTIIYHSSYLPDSLYELWVIRILAYLTRSKYLIVEHDCRHLDARSARWITRYRSMVDRAQQLVLIGSRTYAAYTTYGLFSRVTSCEDAFLPPDISTAAAIESSYPHELRTFLTTMHPCILVTASRYVFYEGKELYGLDTAYALHTFLRTHFSHSGLIIAISQTEQLESYVGYLMRDNPLDETIFVLRGNYELWPLFGQINLFIRPTWSDGASVSIQEAVFMKTPVIASNVCLRPSKVYTYPVHDINALRQCALNVLTQKRKFYDTRNYSLHAQ